MMFFDGLLCEKDFMTEYKFRMLLDKLNIKDNSLHESVLGDVLEGVIVHVHKITYIPRGSASDAEAIKGCAV